jgi:hypothetical protein
MRVVTYDEFYPFTHVSSPDSNKAIILLPFAQSCAVNIRCEEAN